MSSDDDKPPSGAWKVREWDARGWVIALLTAVLMAVVGAEIGSSNSQAEFEAILAAHASLPAHPVSERQQELHRIEAERRLFSIERKLDELLRRTGP